MNEKEMQEQVVMYQLLQGTLDELQKQLVLVQKKLNEITATEMAIKAIREAQKELDILVPVGTGTYGFGKIEDTNKILVNVGADILMEKTPENAEEFLKKRSDEIMEAAGKIERDMKKIVGRMNEIATILNNTTSNQQSI